MDNNIGLCAVYFSQENKYIRWPILSSWKEAGERVLVGLTGADASSAPMGPRALRRHTMPSRYNSVARSPMQPIASTLKR
jgi:hypothetical protein